MSRIILFILLSLITQSSCAQKAVKHIVKTPDGTIVHLYDDYTWAYSRSSTSSGLNKNRTGSTGLYSSNADMGSSRKSSSSKKGTTRKTGSGRTYQRGPRGGCYYYTAGGSKVYVDRSLCN
ncbi:hypothetical protein SAMN04487894_10451 [Niabella drilacis]|uniref:PBCV-specific basic adaptor domain-containing protein n=1 Tax=Niabella drilacis (strain DSM 25811 / CCM 8410 / CCUG 62505 / LMG 26954 / E90) TaxID=1285928 RepID=A0A1G6PIE8_NIADE|nr:hypothetical protein SAMN04487894_10451 [Niabella drilacis]